MKRETKIVGGIVTEAKEDTRNGVRVGLVEGYIATWTLDEGNDRFHKGAFVRSLAEHKSVRGDRPVRLKDHHARTVGGFPLEHVREDDKGLFGRGEIALDNGQGSALFDLVKLGFISDFSIGFSVVESTFNTETLIRDITEAKIWEGSLVDEPMNQAAQVTGFKSAAFGDLPLASEDTPWVADEALDRVSNHPNRKNAYLDDDFLFLIADVVEGELKVVPQAVIQVSKSLLAQAETRPQPSLQAHLERYFLKMRVKSPFAESEYHGVDEVKDWTPRQIEHALKASGRFSKSAAKLLAGRVEVVHTIDIEEQKKLAQIHQELEAMIGQ